MKLLMITRKVDRTDALAGFTYQWIRAFAAAVSELHVICLEKGDASGLPENCTVYSLGKEQGKNRVREFIRFHALAARVVPKVDGVFSHQNPEYGILIAPWAKLYRKKLIAWYTHRAVTWKLRLLTALADTMVTASAESFRLASSKLRVLSHGIDTDTFHPDSTKKSLTHKTVLTVSRLSPSKNIDLMIDAVERISREMPCVFAIVGGPVRAGDREYVDRLKEKVQEKGLGTVVRFVGPVPYPDLPRYYQQADLFLNCSDTGSLDKAVLEAMASGVPVVTTNEAFRWLARDIDPTWYADHDAESVAHKSLRLLSEDVESSTKAARQYIVRQHSLGSLISDIVDLYAKHN